MNAVENEHAWFHEQIATAVVDGLSPDERSRFDAHARTCDSCAAELARMKASDDELTKLFASAKPDAGLEDRVIQNLRVARQRMIPPIVYRAATGIAAALLLGGFGYFATGILEQQTSVGRVNIASDLREIGQARLQYSNENKRGINGRQFWDVNRENAVRRLANYSQAGVPAQEKPVSRGAEVRFDAGDSVLMPNDEAEDHVKERHRIVVTDDNDFEKTGSGTLTINGGNSYGSNMTITGGAVIAGKPVAPADLWFKPAELGSKKDYDDKGKTDLSVVAGTPAQPAQKEPQLGPDAVALGEGVVAGVPVVATTQPGTARKVIHTANMEFEVDSFDSAYARVVKLVKEAGGYVGSTDSEKLPNGKVKGTVALRVPPDKLETLVTQLRGVGDLKSQKLGADDISKQYTDLESQLKAARAMEERLLEIIKTGKGQIKDLLAAEKELGEWRTRIEKYVGEMKYYDNLVAMATLNLTLFEKDIKTLASAIETETVDSGVETEDVEKARAEALKAIEEAKGRVIQSDLKRYDAGQYTATIVADVSPEKAGPLIDRIKQLGKVARLDIQRKQTDHPDAPGPSVRVEKRETRINLSLYNLANVAPRQTTNMSIAADDVEAAYRAIIERVTKLGGRVVTSSISRGRPEQTTASMQLEISSASADALATELSAAGDTVSSATTENPDTANVTAAKRGFAIQLSAAASLPPRETTTLAVELKDVDKAIAAMNAAASGAGGKIVDSNLSRGRDGQTAARVVIDVPQNKANEIINAAKAEGTLRDFQTASNAQVPAGSLARSRIEITFGTADAIVEPGRGFFSSIREGLATSIAGLLWSLRLIIVGLLFVVPWIVVIVASWKIWRRLRRKPLAQ